MRDTINETNEQRNNRTSKSIKKSFIVTFALIVFDKFS